jgi:hypothetical protein
MAGPGQARSRPPIRKGLAHGDDAVLALGDTGGSIAPERFGGRCAAQLSRICHRAINQKPILET